jgi:hypothetical protein
MHHQLKRSHRPARLLAAGAVLAAATTIAACGSSSPNTASSAATSATSVASNGSDSTSSPLAFSKCMRANGVPNFPAPKVITTNPDGNQGVYLPGINPHSPAFQAGAKACGGGPKGP